MKFTFAVASLLLSVSAILADTQSVSYDANYDNAGASLSTVACSGGANGLITRGYSTFGSLPSWPLVAASSAVDGYNSSNCGTCWQLTYTNAQGSAATINVTAIDKAQNGFILGLNTMNSLTNGQAVQLGRVNVDVVQVPSANCGL